MDGKIKLVGWDGASAPIYELWLECGCHYSLDGSVAHSFCAEHTKGALRELKEEE